MTQKPIFRPIESKEVPYLKVWMFSSVISLLIILIGYLLLLFHTNCLSSVPLYIIVLAMILAIIPLNFLLCAIDRYFLKRSKKQYNKVLIDHKGITFLNTYNQIIIAKILWNNIQRRYDQKYDIELLISGGRYLTFYFIWSLRPTYDAKIPLWSAQKFASMFSKFTNAHELTRTLISGIVTFRPDIRIDSEVYTIYKIDPVTLEKDYALIKQMKSLEFKFFAYSIIGTLIIISLICVFINQ